MPCATALEPCRHSHLRLQLEEILHHCKILTEKFFLLFQGKCMKRFPKHSHSWVCCSVVSLIHSTLLETKKANNLIWHEKAKTKQNPDLISSGIWHQIYVWQLQNGAQDGPWAIAWLKDPAKGSPSKYVEGRHQAATYSANDKCHEKSWSTCSQAGLLNRIMCSALQSYLQCWGWDSKELADLHILRGYNSYCVSRPLFEALATYFLLLCKGVSFTVGEDPDFVSSLQS